MESRQDQTKGGFQNEYKQDNCGDNRDCQQNIKKTGIRSVYQKISSRKDVHDFNVSAIFWIGIRSITDSISQQNDRINNRYIKPKRIIEKAFLSATGRAIQ